MKLDDAAIRAALVRQVLEPMAAITGGRVQHEVAVGDGVDACRLDLLVVTDGLHGYEIKSEVDVLTRLPTQARTYGAVAHQMTLVATPRHLERGRRLVPDWWGLMAAEADGAGGVVLLAVRPARPNPVEPTRHLWWQLWNDELRQALADIGQTKGLSSANRVKLAERFGTAYGTAAARRRVCECLKARTDWTSKDVKKPRTTGGKKGQAHAEHHPDPGALEGGVAPVPPVPFGAPS